MNMRRHARPSPDLETPSPQLYCPECDQPLIRRQTTSGRVKTPEGRHLFECRAHGSFEYHDQKSSGRAASAPKRSAGGA